jgi:hypothetical protein
MEYSSPLVLTTPRIRGQRVKDAQWLMQGHSRFGDLGTYKDGPLDGDYGPLTAGATRRTKYWLGYANADINRVFGQTLYEYLRPSNWRALPNDYRLRRHERLAAAALTPGFAALNFAKTQLGYKETPINRTKYGEWYRWNGVFWCAIFESYCFAHSKMPRPRFHYASCELMYLDAKAGRNGLRLAFTPKPGDLAIYRLHGDPYAHTGFYLSHHDSSSFNDLGGNTGPVNISNGGMVLEQRRAYSMVSHYIRVE